MTSVFDEIVYISDLLPQRFPAIAEGLRVAFGLAVRTISGTKDIWCRDYMPVEVNPGSFVQFRYDPDYLKDEPHLRTEDAGRLVGLDSRRSDLVVDGGNVVRLGGTAIMTDKVYRENRNHERTRLLELLRETLQVERLVIIPTEPYEPLGHSDGVLRFVDERTLLVNDYSGVEPRYGRRLNDVLRKHGFEIVLLPYTPVLTPAHSGEIPPAAGVYVNVVEANRTVVVPVYGKVEDDVALSVIGKAMPGRRVVPLTCGDLAAEGGVLNCVTWVGTKMLVDGQTLGPQ